MADSNELVLGAPKFISDRTDGCYNFCNRTGLRD